VNDSDVMKKMVIVMIVMVKVMIMVILWNYDHNTVLSLSYNIIITVGDECNCRVDCQ